MSAGSGARAHGAFPPRQVALPGGHAMVIRQATPADLDALAALYQELSLDDRHRRFFSAYRPGRRFFERWVGRNDEGGLVLVAEDDTGRVVADAGYALLDNGNGEFAVTVSPHQRGWLGPFLLDVLAEAARERGVPNLEGAILVTNQPMQAVVAHRGHAITGHDDWSVVDVVIGTQGTVPSWPPADDRPRVLVEGAGGRWHAEQEAEAVGLQVITCPGPAARPKARGCPLLAGGTCPLVDGADAVVVAIPASDPRGAELVGSHRAAGKPVLVEAGGARANVVAELCRALGSAGDGPGESP